MLRCVASLHDVGECRYRYWHEDTRESRLFESVPIDPETGLQDTASIDTLALQPAAEVCLYGWPRHAYKLHLGRTPYEIGNASDLQRVPVPRDEYSFLNRLRLSREDCTAATGFCYPHTEDTICPDGVPDCCDDCVIEFGTLTECASWTVHGMGHTRDAFNLATHVTRSNLCRVASTHHAGACHYAGTRTSRSSTTPRSPTRATTAGTPRDRTSAALGRSRA